MRPRAQILSLERSDWPCAGGVFVASKRRFWVMDPGGRVTCRGSLPHAYVRARFTPVRPGPGMPHRLAVLLTLHAGRGKSVLLMYDGGGNLVFEEMIDATNGLMSARPRAAQSDRLLVGGNSGIYSYHFGGK